MPETEKNEIRGEISGQLAADIERMSLELGELNNQKHALDKRIADMSLRLDEKRRELLGRNVVQGQESSGERDELFSFTKKQYEEAGDLDGTLLAAEKIKDQNERNRCLSHIAIAVLRKEKDAVRADSVAARIRDDTLGYREYYEREKRNYSAQENQ